MFAVLVVVVGVGCSQEETVDTAHFDLRRVDTTDVQFGPDSIATQDIHLSPTFLLNPDQQDRLRRLVDSDTSAARHFRGVLARAVVALNDEPRPIDTLVYEGHLQRHPKRLATKRALLDMEKMRALGYAYTVTERPQFAESLSEYLLAWVRTTVPTGNPINANKLAATTFAFDLVREQLSSDERAEVKAWFETLAEELISTTPSSPDGLNNWHTKRIKLVGLIGLVLENDEFRQYAVDEFHRFVTESLHADGRSRDFEERDALECHTSALDPLVEFAIAADAKGYDLYHYEGPNGGSVAQSVRFLLPFARGDTTHAEWVDSEVSFDRERYEAGQERYRPGRLWEPESALQLFELATAFESDFRPLVDSLEGTPSGGQYPTWHTVVTAAASPEREE